MNMANPSIPPPPRNELEPRTVMTVYPGYAETRGYGYGYSRQPEVRGFLEYWQMIRRHKVAFLLITLCGGLLGLLVSLPQSPVYQASSTLEIQDLNENFLNAQQVNPVSQGNSNTI